MSRPKRRSLADNLGSPETAPQPATNSVVTLSRDKAAKVADEPIAVTVSRDSAASAETASAEGPRRRSPGDHTRHSYHASLYLPEEAQFALREIALVTRRPKPHDVMLEAMADLFERYNKSELAAECRRRITSRDRAKA